MRHAEGLARDPGQPYDPSRPRRVPGWRTSQARGAPAGPIVGMMAPGPHQETSMSRLAALVAPFLLACLPAAALAHATEGSSPPPDRIDAAARPAVAVVDAFSAALASLDVAKAGALLADDVLVLESGAAERSRAEYLASHAGADALFLQQARVRRLHRDAHAAGDLAWVATESEVSTQHDDRPVLLRSTETMVLRRTGSGWRIVHIHWSSARRPSG
jgi:ketosteroid isomerase-like protein